MIRIEPRNINSAVFSYGVPIVSAFVALILASIPLWLAGAPILISYVEMAKGVFGSKFAFSEMLTRATPLMFTGLAAALAFRAKLWNIGAEGRGRSCFHHRLMERANSACFGLPFGN